MGVDQVYFIIGEDEPDFFIAIGVKLEMDALGFVKSDSFARDNFRSVYAQFLKSGILFEHHVSMKV